MPSNPPETSRDAAVPGVIEVGAGLVFREQRLLITQRRAGDHLGGLWEFPGGKREANESFEECLVRELREELRIEVAVAALVESVEHEYPQRRVLIRFYQCDWISGEPKAVGCQDFRWVVAGELDRYPFPAADAGLVSRLRQSPELWSKATGAR